MTNWIFQGNPENFKVDEYIYNQDLIMWTINQRHFKEEILPGDVVYIWRSDGNKPKSGGIIAKGKIVSPPEEMLDDAPDLWINKQENSFKLRVKIELEDIRLNEEEGMLMRIDMEKDENLKDMRILKFRAEANYKLYPKYSKHIDYLWESKKDKSTDLALRNKL